MAKKLVSIIIPIYKESLNEYELISLKQCIKVLGNHPIRIIAPYNLDFKNYIIYFKDTKDFEIERFNDIFFENIQGYNKLLLSIKFYERFDNFKYILIYQLDAFVFRDELEYWCDQGFDYIGAPWVNMNLFQWLQTGLYPKKLYYYHRFFGKGRFLSRVGNGGLSLRNVKACYYNNYIFKKTSLKWRANEDSYFSHYVKTYNPFFRLAPFKTALKFSFDAFPQKAYEKNNYNLPFGCHGWYRNESHYEKNYSFWRDIIEENI